jgi:hypothetical protein
MAIYQFYLAVFPKEGIKKIKGSVPAKLKYNDFTGFFDENTERYWKATKIKSTEIISYIDELLPRASWGNDNFNHNWKLENDSVDNDAWISLEDKNLVLQEFNFRADLREENLAFLRKMIELGKRKNLLFVTSKGYLIEPEEVFKHIKTSNALKYITNPEEFFDNLSSGKIKIE